MTHVHYAVICKIQQQTYDRTDNTVVETNKSMNVSNLVLNIVMFRAGVQKSLNLQDVACTWEN